MSRVTKYMGLNKKAKKFLDKKSRKLRCTLEKEKYSFIEGTFFEKVPLYRYKIGVVTYFEFLQRRLHENGDWLYIALKNDKGCTVQSSLWEESNFH